MTTTPRPAEVRQLVVRTLQALGIPLGGQSEIKETIFLNDGKCMARSYRAAGMLAMWMVDEGLVQFYDAQGNMLRTVTLPDDARRLAA